MDRFTIIEKTAADIRLAAFFDEMEKIGAVDPALYQMLKEAGVFERLGRAAKRGYEAAQVGTGNLMTGSFGHAGEHAAHKLMTTASPTKALMVAAADPHAQKAVLRGAQKAGKHVSTKARNVLERARHAVMPVGPSPVPAMAV